MIHTKLLQMTKESLSGERRSTLYIYVCIYSLIELNIKTGVFQDFRVVLLSRSLLNFLRTFASLIRNSFFEFGKILPHPRGIRRSFLPRGRELDKKICPGLARSKQFSPGLPGGGGEGMYPVGID